MQYFIVLAQIAGFAGYCQVIRVVCATATQGPNMINVTTINYLAAISAQPVLFGDQTINIFWSMRSFAEQFSCLPVSVVYPKLLRVRSFILESTFSSFVWVRLIVLFRLFIGALFAIAGQSSATMLISIKELSRQRLNLFTSSALMKSIRRVVASRRKPGSAFNAIVMKSAASPARFVKKFWRQWLNLVAGRATSNRVIHSILVNAISHDDCDQSGTSAAFSRSYSLGHLRILPQSEVKS